MLDEVGGVCGELVKLVEKITNRIWKEDVGEDFSVIREDDGLGKLLL